MAFDGTERASIAVTLADGRSVRFHHEGASADPPVIVLGVRKSGSSMLHAIWRALASAACRPFLDVGGGFFDANIASDVWRFDPAVIVLLRPGMVLGGFRDLPVALAGQASFQAAPKILLVRDPRDALVSEYFSCAYSHSLPAAEGTADEVGIHLRAARAAARADGIDAWVLARAVWMRRTMLEYAALRDMQGLSLYRYEDVIACKRPWVARMAAAAGMSLREDVTDVIADEFDQWPATEDPHAFVRRVHPGDHRDKLRPETIALLDASLADVLDAFRYPASAGARDGDFRSSTVA